MIGSRRRGAMLKEIVAGTNARKELPKVTLVLKQKVTGRALTKWMRNGAHARNP
jgi:hypothetical protein